MRPAVLVRAAALAAVLAAASAGPAAADVFELADGTKLDGKLVHEKDGFLWVQTLTETRRLAAADVKSRSPGTSAVDTLAALRAKVAKDPKDAAALWDLYLFCAEHQEESKDLAKEAKTLPAKVLKLAPDHEGANEAIGNVRYEGRWVKQAELERLEAEARAAAKKNEYQQKLGVLVEVAEGEHWTIVDNTGAKDLPKKLKDLDEAYRLSAEYLGQEKFWDGQSVAYALKRHADFVRILEELGPGWHVPQDKLELAKDPRNAGLWRHHPTQFQIRAIPEQKQDAEDGMWAAFVHMVPHVCIWSMKRAGPPPAWFEEGVAAVIETEVRGIQKAYCVATPPADRNKTTDKPRGKKGANELQGEQSIFKEHCKRAVDGGTFPEMRKFLRMTMADFGPAECGGAIGLVTWLRAKDPEKFKQLWAELRAGAKRDDDPWKKVYGYDGIEAMESEWKTWVRTEW